MILTFQIDDSEIKALERINYEITISRRLISFFVNLCDTDGKRDMLKDYIFDYQKTLEQDELHFELLKNKIVEDYFPQGEDKKTTDFSINFDRGEITYYVKRNAEN